MTTPEEVFRSAWPVVVASTARLTRDLDLAEDCTQEAVERALRRWPAGFPDNPAGWLTTTAHRIALDRLRREATLRRKLPLLVDPASGAGGSTTGGSATPGSAIRGSAARGSAIGEDADPEPTDPLRLVFTCCHPALSSESRVALTLRLVCGVDVATIAAVLLAGEAAVARRITRAKRTIAVARVPFRVPRRRRAGGASRRGAHRRAPRVHGGARRARDGTERHRPDRAGARPGPDAGRAAARRTRATGAARAAVADRGPG